MDWDPRAARWVVMTAAGYPGPYRKGDVIEGLPRHDEGLSDDGQAVPRRHAGNQGGSYVTYGGQVLCATALGGTVASRRKSAYNLVKLAMRWDGAYYR